jgi:lipid A 3-O-deacylase
LSLSKGREKAARMWRSFFGRRQGTRERADKVTGVAKALRRAKRFAFFLVLASARVASAQMGNQPESSDVGHLEYPNLTAGGAAMPAAEVSNLDAGGRPEPAAANPVAEVRDRRSWEYGPFANWGTGVGERSDFKFFWAGFELSKILSPVVHAGFLSGQFQYGGYIIPIWLGFTPPPHNVQVSCLVAGQLTTCPYPYGGGTFHGVSVSPVVFRWNFLTRSRRWQPWFQAAGGLIYTTHKFPPDYLSNKALGIDGGTSVWNFSPQGGFGMHYFIRDKRSIDVNVNGVHISSASLGDRNPGVNASVQVQVGYTFWK